MKIWKKIIVKERWFYGKVEKYSRKFLCEYREKYHLKNMPNQEFINLVLDIIDNKSFEAINKLYWYVMEDFKITDFVLKSEVK